MLNNLLRSIGNLSASASIRMACHQAVEIDRHQILPRDGALKAPKGSQDTMLVPAGAIVAIDIRTPSANLVTWGKLQKEAYLDSGTAIFVGGKNPTKINPTGEAVPPVDFEKLSAFEGPRAALRENQFYVYSARYVDGGLYLIDGALSTFATVHGYPQAGAVPSSER